MALLALRALQIKLTRVGCAATLHGMESQPLTGVFQESCRLKLKIMPPFSPQVPDLVFLD